MKTHLKNTELDGATKCGSNVYTRWLYNSNREKIGEEKFVTNRVWVRFTDNESECDCKRCLNKVKKSTTVEITDEELSGKVFHRSFGYDMTINVFAKVLKRTKRGLKCVEVKSILWGDTHGHTSSGKARASNEVVEDAKPFIMMKKKSADGYTYFTGARNRWYLEDVDKAFYENHWD